MAEKAEAIWNEWKERKQNKSAGSYEFFDAYMKAKAEVEKLYPDGIYMEKPLPPRVKEVLHTH
jgi:hypothetical protein